MFDFVRKIFNKETLPQPEEDWDVASLPITTDPPPDGDDNDATGKTPEDDVVKAPTKENTPVKKPRKKRGT